jgi:MSHA biogenesis protein MshN
MSLINRMLQDLEARRTDGSGSSSIHDQVRVAPQPRRIPLTWAFALAAVLVATALLSWLWGRQTAPATLMASQSGQPQLALRVSSGIKPVPVPQVPAPQEPNGGMQQPAFAAQSITVPKESPPSASTAAADRPGAPHNVMTAPGLALPNPQSAAATGNRASALPAMVNVPSEATDHLASRVPVHGTNGTSAGTPVPETIPGNPAASPNAPRLRTAKEVGLRSGQNIEGELPVAVTKQIKEASPQQRADAEYLKASSLIQQGRSGEALSVLELALRIDPQNATVRQTLAGLLVEAKRSDEAIVRLQEGLATDRAQPGMAMLLARLQLDKGDLRPAIETLQRSQSYAGDRADYQAFLAALYQRDSRHKEAVEHYIAALRKSPQNGIWWMGLGISLQTENRLNEARDAFVRSKATSTLPPDLLAFVEQKVSQLR